VLVFDFEDSVEDLFKVLTFWRNDLLLLSVFVSFTMFWCCFIKWSWRANVDSNELLHWGQMNPSILSMVRFCKWGVKVTQKVVK